METDVLAKEKSNNRKIYWAYVILFFIFVFKMFFYVNENFATPDDIAQMSYVAYMELHPEVWIPDFAEIPMYNRTFINNDGGQIIYRLEDSGVACYLGHPPLYYKMMALFDCVSTDVEGNIYLNFTKLRVCNILLTAFTMLLVMVAGYKLLKKSNSEWYMHLLFYAIATSLPLYGYVGSGVNNDNLCNLGLVVVWLGLISYIDEGYSYKTFWLVAIGLAVTVLAKVTTGVIVLVAVVIMILVDIVKTRKLGIIFNKYFATTLPIYAVVLHYFLTIYSIFSTFQPTYKKYAREDYENSSFYIEAGTGGTISFIGDLEHHFGTVWDTWCATYNSSYMLTREGIFSVAYGVVLILFILIMLIELFKFLKEHGKYNNVVMFAFGVGVIVLLINHFERHYNSHSAGKYAGGSQGRYYMSIIPVVAMGATQVVDIIQKKCGPRIQSVGKYLIIAFAVWMVYLDFFYFMQYIYNIF